ncbi:MAG TPA: pyruvate dehydrogenase complex dihydrolipoamide acetyltransferase [Ktedonobacteraceae bacterium]|nr:pyruvate dehydrogenase complex dihydrolipoamide acetyltransferase [Ktedonobacteraceae bacterium]
MPEITMPRLSDTMQEGTIARWLKKPGDKVNKGDILGEIETDKATMDLEAYDAGVLEQILVQEGETASIGQPIAIIGTGTAAAAQPQQEQPARAAAASDEQTAQPAPPVSSAPPAAPAASAQREAAPAGNGAVKASPLARRMAEEYGLDLSQIHGTGPGGRIVRDDILDFREEHQPAVAQAPQQAPAAAPAPAPATQPAPTTAPAIPPDAEVVKLTRVQQLIAKRLTESKQTIPHYYISSEVDMTDLLAMRQTLNASAGEEGEKITVNDLIMKAAALALEKFPEVNSTLKDDSFIRYKHINIGMAVDAPTGLVVPVIRDTNIKGVRSIARESKALIAKARNNKLAPADLEGGTFSVSNLGMMDTSTFIAVINPPQAAILAVAAARKQFVPIDGQPVIRDMMTMTLSADHRIISGATVARFLQEVKRLLQNPYSLLG